MEINIRLIPRSVVPKLLLIVAGLIGLSLIGRLLLCYYAHIPGIKSLAHQFYLDEEFNIPALYSALAIGFAAALLYAISRFEALKQSAQARSWKILAGIFLYLSMDELNSFHEILIEPLRRRFGLSGLFYYAWVLPAIALVIVFVLGFMKFLWQLNRSTRYRFLAAGGIFVLGAVGFEMLGATVVDRLGEAGVVFNPLYQALMTTEETLEMLGIIGFIDALLRYLNRHHGVRSLILHLPVQRISRSGESIGQAEPTFSQTDQVV
jgi:hypothetical protein